MSGDKRMWLKKSIFVILLLCAFAGGCDTKKQTENFRAEEMVDSSILDDWKI